MVPYSYHSLGRKVDHGYGPERAAWVSIPLPTDTTPITVDFGALGLDVGRFTPIAAIFSQINLVYGTTPPPLSITFASGRIDLVQQMTPGLDLYVAFPPAERPSMTIAWTSSTGIPSGLSLNVSNVPPINSRVSSASYGVPSSVNVVNTPTVDIGNTPTVDIAQPNAMPNQNKPSYFIGTTRQGAVGGIPSTDSYYSQEFVSGSPGPFSLNHIALYSPHLTLNGIVNAGTGTELLIFAVSATNGTDYYDIYRVPIPCTDNILMDIIHLPDFLISSMGSGWSLAARVYNNSSGYDGYILFSGAFVIS